jgi:low affinity Fe/Cu permease
MSGDLSQSKSLSSATTAPERELFRRFSHKCAETLGSAGMFVLALLVILVWGLTGPFFHYSDAWQLIINTGTTIVTFLMVFIIQNTQNRDSKAIHLKLDELIRAQLGARDDLVSLEDMSDRELVDLEAEFRQIREKMSRRRNRITLQGTAAGTGPLIEPLP